MCDEEILDDPKEIIRSPDVLLLSPEPRKGAGVVFLIG